MKKIGLWILVGILLLSMVSCGKDSGSGGTSSGSETPATEPKSEDISKDSEGFGESPEIEDKDDRYMGEATPVEIDGKTYNSKAILLQKPLFGNYVQNMLVSGEDFYLAIIGGEESTLKEDGFFTFKRKGDVLAEQKEVEVGAYRVNSLMDPSMDNQGNIYYYSYREIVKLTPQGFMKALGLELNGRFQVSPDGNHGILEYATSDQELTIDSTGKIELKDSENKVDSVGMKVEIKDGKFTGEATPIENYYKEGYEMGWKMYRTQKHIYSVIRKDNKTYARQTDFDGKETLLIDTENIRGKGLMGIKGVAELDGKILLFGDGVVVLDEKGNFLKYIMMDQFSAKTKDSDGSYLINAKSGDKESRPRGIDYVYQDKNGRIYGALRMESQEEDVEDELVVFELLTYNGK